MLVLTKVLVWDEAGRVEGMEDWLLEEERVRIPPPTVERTVSPRELVVVITSPAVSDDDDAELTGAEVEGGATVVANVVEGLFAVAGLEVVVTGTTAGVLVVGEFGGGGAGERVVVSVTVPCGDGITRVEAGSGAGDDAGGLEVGAIDGEVVAEVPLLIFVS